MDYERLAQQFALVIHAQDAAGLIDDEDRDRLVDMLITEVVVEADISAAENNDE